MLMTAAALLVLPILPNTVLAQGDGMQAWQDEAVADLEQMRDKFLSLVEAFPEEMWAWTPMEDTPSVRDIMLRILLWGRIAPPRWGAEHIYAPEVHEVAPTLAGERWDRTWLHSGIRLGSTSRGGTVDATSRLQPSAQHFDVRFVQEDTVPSPTRDLA
jgi:hypothetical protein